jgi:transposase
VLPAHIYVMVKAAAEELAPTIHDLRRKGYSYREIAQTLGVSTKLVYNVLHSTSDTGGTGGMGDMGGNTP